MNNQQARVIIETKIHSVIPSGTTILFGNINFAMSSRATTVQSQISFNVEELVAMGSPALNTVGILTVNVFTPEGEGVAANLTMTDTLKHELLNYSSQGLFIQSAEGPQVVSSPSPQGLYQTRTIFTFQYS